MYEYVINDYTVCELIYTPNTIYPWSMQKYVKQNDKWNKSTFKRFETLEQARDYCIKLIRKEKSKHARMDQ